MRKNLAVIASSGVLVLALAAVVSPALGSTRPAAVTQAIRFKPHPGDPPVITHVTTSGSARTAAETQGIQYKPLQAAPPTVRD